MINLRFALLLSPHYANYVLHIHHHHHHQRLKSICPLHKSDFQFHFLCTHCPHFLFYLDLKLVGRPILLISAHIGDNYQTRWLQQTRSYSTGGGWRMGTMATTLNRPSANRSRVKPKFCRHWKPPTLTSGVNAGHPTWPPVEGPSKGMQPGQENGSVSF